MVFIETPVFTRQVQQLLTDEAYAEFQWYLALNPQAGPVIEGTGGLRKVRWALPGAGKRGGLRVIYFHLSAQAQVRLLLIYPKGMKDDLNAAEKKALRAVIEKW